MLVLYLAAFSFFGFASGLDVDLKETDPLYNAWNEFLNLQKNQTLEFGKDFPVDERLYGNLKKCGHFSDYDETLSDSLPPAAIEIYAEIGHLATFCRTDRALLHTFNRSFQLNDVLQSFKQNCLQSMQTKSQNPTLPKILRLVGANLEIFESNIPHGNLQIWTKHIVKMIQRATDYNDRWKLILIAPGLFDLRPGSYTHELVHDVMQSIQVIQHKLPEKTMVIVLRNAGQSFLQNAGEKFIFCEKILSTWHFNTDKAEQEWNVLEARVKNNYQGEEFYVHVLNMLEGSRPLTYAKTYDISPLSADCVHFSSRGLSLLHTHLWNWLVQPARRTQWSPLVRPLYCPRPTCPYIVTTKNMWICPQTKRRVKVSDGQNVLILGLLCSAVFLYAVLFVYITCS